ALAADADDGDAEFLAGGALFVGLVFFLGGQASCGGGQGGASGEESGLRNEMPAGDAHDAGLRVGGEGRYAGTLFHPPPGGHTPRVRCTTGKKNRGPAAAGAGGSLCPGGGCPRRRCVGQRRRVGGRRLPRSPPEDKMKGQRGRYCLGGPSLQEIGDWFGSG